MIVLALDTALEACSVAVLRDDEPLAARSEPMARGHQERLAPLVAEAMAQAGLGFEALDQVAVTVGPGSFTGLRVGLAFAKALSLALDIPCTGVGTLEALAAGAPEWPDAPQRPDATQKLGAPLLLAVLDARREQVYLQAFGHGVALTAPANLALSEALALGERLGVGASTPMVGSGAALLDPARACDGGAANVDPVVLARLAAARPPPTGRPQPLYLRAPDARTIAERARIAAG